VSEQLKACLDSRPLCLVARPIAGIACAGVCGGVLAAFAGLVYGLFHGSLDFVVLAGLRGAFAGAAAGFLAGVYSGLDRLTWPDSWQEVFRLQAPVIRMIARNDAASPRRSMVGRV
jgi:hypothetical protein